MGNASMTIQYKFAEVAPVTAEALESVVNEGIREGWRLDVIHFVTRDNSHRPAMAFVAFIRDVAAEPGGASLP
jgi:hypothetical protein